MKFSALVISFLLLCVISEALISDVLNSAVSVTVRQGIEIRTTMNKIVDSIKSINSEDYDDNPAKDVHFYLYTRHNGTAQELFINDTDSIKQSNYNTTIPTKLVTHGWNSNYSGLSVSIVKNALLLSGDYNVVALDWGTYARQDYITAVIKVLTISKQVVEIVTILIGMGSDPKQITLVGHSLGAQIVGLAGLKLRENNNTVGHIVGLDPAGPGYEMLSEYRRISTLDATFVEIIHTNPGRLGMLRSVGHVDYYVNGDDGLQPGCEPDFQFSCSHRRAYMYYAEALTRPDAWFGIRCPRLGHLMMGWCENHTITRFPLAEANASKPQGTYLLLTNNQSFFGRGLEGITPQAAIQFRQTQISRYREYLGLIG